jgi:hypothetical protein
MHRRILGLLFLGSLASVGCSSSNSTTTTTPTGDAAADAMKDAPSDGETADAKTDASSDAAEEAAADAAPDVTAEAGPDAGDAALDVATEAGLDAGSDATAEAAADAAPEATTDATTSDVVGSDVTTTDSAASTGVDGGILVGNADCVCDEAAAACVQGTLLQFTPASPTKTATASITAPGSGNQDYVDYDLDVSAFPNGGTIAVTGTVNASLDGGPVSAASFDLFLACSILPTAGSPDSVASDDDVQPGSTLTVTYPFSAGEQLFHFGATGNWGSTQGETNTVSLTFTVTD